ncbi:hypothetical protein DLD77_05045 [Chitinophaga alhagiae]|uniref:DUF3592 domain-containing protein n=1 Tax=Chitinophaga alhagiae TaxID=2203219 RepID=A0ABM6WAY8_9BACT|nr:hypothetical protein [Chitinophaga alhagiae]AWO01106.1 hypothetical protein DLD77_05045 [Chitinophaga alhagiae]
MKGFWKYFWIIYALFFAIPFPMIIYYNTGYRLDDTGSNPWLALFYLLLSVVAWALVLWSFFRGFILGPVKAKQDVAYLLREGARKEAVIVRSEQKGPLVRGFHTYTLTLAFRNFAGEEIKEQLAVVDSRPEERRFEEGERVTLRIDERLKTNPLLVLDDARAELRPGVLFLLMLAWLAIAAAVVWYYMYAYGVQHNGKGWRFLVFYHPLVLCPLILLFTRFGIGRLLGMLTGIPQNAQQLKYYGRRTSATVLSASQTGTYINNQPQVRFELQYTDRLGQSHTATLKKVVPLINMGITQMPRLPVFYLEEKPGQVALASDPDS